MIYLSGHVHESALRRPDFGVILTPNMGNRPNLSRAVWAVDNGCYSRGDRFSPEFYLNWLAGWFQEDRARCLFATAPDVLGDAEATLARSVPLLPELRRLNYKAALVAQDGLERLCVPWDDFDVLFVGGSTQWKLSEAAYTLAREADERGKWVHMGRVNSWRRLKAAAVSGYDSADGTYLKHGPNVLLPKVVRWLDTLRLTEFIPC